MSVQPQQHGAELAVWLVSTCKEAKEAIKDAQMRQKLYYGQKNKPSNFVDGNHVFLFKQAEKTREVSKHR